tara:strand:+ start:7387 stop:7626 length:240 start_codon:yes stop_codon:yes gene_type:complete
MLKRLSWIIEQAWRGGASRFSVTPGRSPRQPFISRLRAKYDAANTTLDKMETLVASRWIVGCDCELARRAANASQSFAI